MMLMPIIIPMPIYNNGVHGGHAWTLNGLILAIVGTIWVIQVISVWIALFMDDLEKKRTLLWWHIPILPCIVATIIKLKNIGK